jgi:nitrogen fixation protein NifZ
MEIKMETNMTRLTIPREPYEIGDVIYARETMINDGGIPDIAPDAILATPGRRGVIVNFGHVEAALEMEIYLVRFENGDGDLGPPVGCLPDELTQDEAEARQLASM